MGNMTNDYSTPAHDQLSPLGWEQAERLAERLAEDHFDVLYASPLRRAPLSLAPALGHGFLGLADAPTLPQAPGLCHILRLVQGADNAPRYQDPNQSD